MNPSPRKPRAIRSDKVDPRMPASVVVEKFGGLTRFSDWTGYPTSTVWNWMIVGFIPPRKQSHVLDMARLHGVEVAPADFVFDPGEEAA